MLSIGMIYEAFDEPRVLFHYHGNDRIGLLDSPVSSPWPGTLAFQVPARDH